MPTPSEPISTGPTSPSVSSRMPRYFRTSSLRSGAEHTNRAKSGNPRKHRKIIAGVVSIGLALTGTVAATAYFLSGTGSGTATTQTISGLTLSNGTPSAVLFPGGSTALNVLVSNANSTALGINTIALDTAQGSNGFSIDGAHVTAGCSVASAALTFPTLSTGWTIPAGASSIPLVLGTTPLAMGASAPSACQGASISVFLKAT